MKFKTTRISTHVIGSPLGHIILATTEQGLAGVWFEAQRHLHDMSDWRPDAGHPVLCNAAAQLGAYFAGERNDFDMPLDLSHGTAFQQVIWQALLQIPYGKTISYGALGKLIGNPAAVRAVGAAVGRNPISLIVPCHRVIGSNGALTGYAGGLHRKTALLTLEGAMP